MSFKRNDTERLIKKYQTDIASLEEKEEYLTTRIQVMENLIPTIMVWYMWKVAQARKPGTFSQSHSEEEAKKKLLHLETILEELQEADYILKEDEQVLRSRIQELESSFRESTDENFLRQIDKKEKEAAKEYKRITALEENKIQFKDLLNDPNTDWQSKCKEFCEKINELTEKLEETNYGLKNKDDYINQLQEDLREKDKVVDDKTKDFHKQNKALLSEVIAHEEKRDAEEAYMNKKVHSAVQEAIEEVGAIRASLTKKKSTKEEKDIRGNNRKFSPRDHTITEEECEEETKMEVLDRESPDSRSLAEPHQKVPVFAPDDIPPGSHTSTVRPRTVVRPLPRTIDSLGTVKESSSAADLEVKLRTTATGTTISIPPDVSKMPSVNTEDLSPVRRTSSQPEPVSQHFQTSHPEQPTPTDRVARQHIDQAIPTSTIYEDQAEHNVPLENYISGIDTKAPPLRPSKEASVLAIPNTQVLEVSPTDHNIRTKSLDEPSQPPSTAAEVRVELLFPEQQPESRSALETIPETPEGLEDQPRLATKVPLPEQDSVKRRSLGETVVSSQSSKPARSPQMSEVLTVAPQSKLNNILVKPESQASPENRKGKSVTVSEPISSTSKAAAVTSEGQAIISEPYEVSHTDGVQGIRSGLALQQEAGTLKPHPSKDSLTGQSLQSKCRVKDHLIKNMADNLKDLARKNKWSGDKLFKDISRDPVKTYDFDRTTLYKYIKGQEPRDVAPSLKSNEPYSSSNPLIVTLGRKVDKDSLLLEWGPPPAQEVVGFQIFINGEFKYWVYSAKRSKAILHPVDLATKMDITVSPVNAKGDIVYRSSVAYNP